MIALVQPGTQRMEPLGQQLIELDTSRASLIHFDTPTPGADLQSLEQSR
jgi:hypothetical protein